jgi:hypothetical protein
VSLLRRAALESQSHIAVRRLAEQFCQGLASKDYTSEYLAIYYGILGRTRYMKDPRTVELVKAPYLLADEILQGGTPSIDCDDYAALLAALDLSVGGSCSLVTVAFRNAFFQGQRQYSHVLARALVPGSRAWVIQDPVAAENTASMRRRVVAAKVWPVA